MKIYAWLVAVLVWLAASGVAGAHIPGRIEIVKAGAYQVVLGLPKGAVPAGQSFLIDVGVPQEATGWDVWAAPGPQTDGVRVHAMLEPRLNMASVVLPVAGKWLLDVTVDGPSGRGEAVYAITATAPRKMPVWMAWTIALLPLGGFAVFCLREWRRVVKRAR